jgi:hypothetical protein
MHYGLPAAQGSLEWAGAWAFLEIEPIWFMQWRFLITIPLESHTQFWVTWLCSYESIILSISSMPYMAPLYCSLPGKLHSTWCWVDGVEPAPSGWGCLIFGPDWDGNIYLDSSSLCLGCDMTTISDMLFWFWQCQKFNFGQAETFARDASFGFIKSFVCVAWSPTVRCGCMEPKKAGG